MLAASVIMWPASAKRARLPERIPPITSATMNVVISPNAIQRLRLPAPRRSWEWELFSCEWSQE